MDESEIKQGETAIATAETAIDPATPLVERVEATETLYQEVIDFLHWMFPGHVNLPGKSSTQIAAAAADPTANLPLS